MPDDTAREKGRVWEQKRVCSYCGREHSGEDLGFVHRNENGNPDWSICFLCTKRFFDRVLKKKTNLAEMAERCSYCGEQKAPYLSHYDRDDRLVWLACYDCVRRAFDDAMKRERVV